VAVPHASAPVSERRLGVAYALGAYALWGVLPLYLRALHAVPSLQVVAHRIVWAAVLLAGFVVATGRHGFIQQLLQRPRRGLTFVASSLALLVNWLVYIWAVEQGRVVDASLGYFINPLLNVVLAVVILKERLRAWQWSAVAVAGLGVLWLALLARQLPWIGLTVAVSFGCYGLLRKTASLDALGGLLLETMLLLPLALGYLVYLSFTPRGMFAGAGPSLCALLLATGPLTAIPLLAFAAGARRIPLSLVGILQYLAPSLQLLIGVMVFHEPLPPAKLLGFGLIWLAVVLYSLEGLAFRARSVANS
jgi:chloramphenicol-sensitive protein RarD